MLKRNLYFAPSSVKSKAYISSVLPILEYANSSWCPTSAKQNNALEMIHHNAARFVCNIYYKKGKHEKISITNVLKSLNWESLEERRNQTRMIMVYKIINDKVILDSSLLPKVTNQRPTRTCNEVKVGHVNQLIEPQSRLDVVKNTFFYAAPQLWNNYVTPLQAKAPSVDAFKQHFKKK